MRLPQVVVDLLAARDAIERLGLAKYIRQHESGSVCVYGALQVAVGDNPGGVWFMRPRIDRAESFLNPVIDCGDWQFGAAEWNDRDERTKEDVLRALDDAASLALSEAVRP